MALRYALYDGGSHVLHRNWHIVSMRHRVFWPYPKQLDDIRFGRYAVEDDRPGPNSEWFQMASESAGEAVSWMRDTCRSFHRSELRDVIGSKFVQSIEPYWIVGSPQSMKRDEAPYWTINRNYLFLCEEQQVDSICTEDTAIHESGLECKISEPCVRRPGMKSLLNMTGIPHVYPKGLIRNEVLDAAALLPHLHKTVDGDRNRAGTLSWTAGACRNRSKRKERDIIH